MFDQNDQASINAGMLAFQTRVAQGLGTYGTTAEVYVQLAITSPRQPQPQILSPGPALTTLASRVAGSPSSAFACENFAYDTVDKIAAGLAAFVELAWDMLNETDASITGTVQVTPYSTDWNGNIATRYQSQNHSVQIAMVNSQIIVKRIETTV